MSAMPSDKPSDTGLPPALADALAAMSAEQRSMRVLEQVFTDEPSEQPESADAADAAMGARLAARTRAHARAFAAAVGLGTPARDAGVSGDRDLPDGVGDVPVEAIASDGVVADLAADLDTARQLAIEQARRDQDDSRPG